MLRRILIANRGEIALRIIKAAKQLDVETVVIYSSADKETLPVQLSDKSICIGPPASAKSYLNQESIIQAAKSLKCDAIHPGYGFLSENAEFAEKCEYNGITFIGPSADIIRKMGDKQAARKLMKKSGVPIVPGSDDVLKSADEAKKIADKIGFPVLLKASAGGGGRGMRVANNLKEIEDAFNAASSEALSAFGNGDLYIEKYIINPRHIEVQILGDKFGNIINLGERDCSVQRRNQKMLEEAPANALSEDVRKNLIDAAIKAAKAAEYFSAGTVEFVLDGDNKFYFIEMNTRVQVEHPVTEMITGVDIVRNQLLVASGEELDIDQNDIIIKGNAIECRVNAEDVENGFIPTPGKVDVLRYPVGEGIRVESAIQAGSTISPWYDSMICKIIVHAPTRVEAIRKMRFALKEFEIEGVKTNKEFLLEILDDSIFNDGNVNTSFIGQLLEKRYKREKNGEKIFNNRSNF